MEIAESPFSRGRGLKSMTEYMKEDVKLVALFTRAWIEIRWDSFRYGRLYSRPFHEGVDWNHMEHRRLLWQKQVALFTRAWIEINLGFEMSFLLPVALFTRAWIEILQIKPVMPTAKRRPFHEGVDWNMTNTKTPIPTARSPFSRGRGLKFKVRAAWTISAQVALFTRAWIEIHLYRPWRTSASSRPFHEGVDWNTIINKINSSTTESPFSRGRGLKWITWYA